MAGAAAVAGTAWPPLAARPRSRSSRLPASRRHRSAGRCTRRPLGLPRPRSCTTRLVMISSTSSSGSRMRKCWRTRRLPLTLSATRAACGALPALPAAARTYTPARRSCTVMTTARPRSSRAPQWLRRQWPCTPRRSACRGHAARCARRRHVTQWTTPRCAAWRGAQGAVCVRGGGGGW